MLIHVSDLCLFVQCLIFTIAINDPKVYEKI